MQLEINHLVPISKGNTGKFWKGIKRLTCKKTYDKDIISSNEWVHYFKSLFNPDDEEYYDNNFLQYVKAALPSIGKQMETCGPLDNEFSIEEIIHATKQLKSNKSCGIDSISNEMIKNVPPVFLEIYALHLMIYYVRVYIPKCGIQLSSHRFINVVITLILITIEGYQYQTVLANCST